MPEIRRRRSPESRDLNLLSAGFAARGVNQPSTWIQIISGKRKKHQEDGCVRMKTIQLSILQQTNAARSDRTLSLSWLERSPFPPTPQVFLILSSVCRSVHVLAVALLIIVPTLEDHIQHHPPSTTDTIEPPKKIRSTTIIGWCWY